MPAVVLDHILLSSLRLHNFFMVFGLTLLAVRDVEVSAIVVRRHRPIVDQSAAKDQRHVTCVHRRGKGKIWEVADNPGKSHGVKRRQWCRWETESRCGRE